MCKKLFIALLLSFSSRSFSIECMALHRHTDEQGQLVQSQSKLEATYDIGGILILETKLNDQLYFFNYNKIEEEGMLQIVDAADNTKGLIARSAFNKKGMMTLSLINNQIVHRLECSK